MKNPFTVIKQAFASKPKPTVVTLTPLPEGPERNRTPSMPTAGGTQQGAVQQAGGRAHSSTYPAPAPSQQPGLPVGRTVDVGGMPVQWVEKNFPKGTKATVDDAYKAWASGSKDPAGRQPSGNPRQNTGITPAPSQARTGSGRNEIPIKKTVDLGGVPVEYITTKFPKGTEATLEQIIKSYQKDRSQFANSKRNAPLDGADRTFLTPSATAGADGLRNVSGGQRSSPVEAGEGIKRLGQKRINPGRARVDETFLTSSATPGAESLPGSSHSLQSAQSDRFRDLAQSLPGVRIGHAPSPEQAAATPSRGLEGRERSVRSL
jgi:hypothetical protein